MADVTITRGTTLPDSSSKTDFHNLVDNATVSVSNIVNADIASGAAIADTKLATISTAGKVSVAALTVSSQAQGDVLYASGATTWARLGAGTDGQFLKTQGAGANPTWADVTVPTAASQAEQETGTEAAKYVAPATQQFHPSAAKGWVVFDGTSASILTGSASYNVTSVADNGDGDYTVNWATDFSSGDFCSQATCKGNNIAFIKTAQAAGTTNIGILQYNGTTVDSDLVCVTSYGDQ